MTTLDPQVAALLKDPDALIPAIVQDSTSKEVLMLAYMNAQSLELTLTTGKQLTGRAAAMNYGSKVQPQATIKMCNQSL